MEKDKEKVLEATIKQLEKDYGKGIVMRLSDKAKVQVPTIPTGSISLDYALGIGGYPRGRIIEIYGQEASGKTTLALMAMAETQKLGGSVLFIDVEHAFDPNYAKIIGVDIEDKKLLISQPEYGEQALGIMEDAIRGGAIDLIVVDSVAALVTKAELEGEMEDQGIGGQARLMSKALRKLTGIISKTGTVAIFINQVREKISQNVYQGPPEITPGGRALKFFSSIRLEVRKGEAIKGPNAEIIGHIIKVKVVKNKLAPPYKTAQFELIYGKGINRIGEIFDLAVELGIIKRAGSWYSYNNEQFKIPKLIDFNDIKGDLQVHSRYSDGVMDFWEIEAEALKMNYEYVAITDHSKSLKVAGGMDIEDLLKRNEEIKKFNRNSKVKLLISAEVEILNDGSLDYPDEILKNLDLVLASIHNVKKDEDITQRYLKAMDNPYVDIIAHPTGRLVLSREPYKLNLDELFKKASERKIILEINAHYNRLDLNDLNILKAKQYGVKFSIGTDAHNRNGFYMMIFGVKMARKGLLTKEDVINSLSLIELLEYIKFCREYRIKQFASSNK